MGDDDPLRSSRRPGRIDHIRRVVRPHPGRRRIRARREIHFVDHHRPVGERLGHRVPCRPVAHHQHGIRVSQQQSHALGRIRGIHRNERASGQRHPQQPDHPPRRPPYDEAHPGLRFDPTGPQHSGERHRLFPEPLEGQLAVAVHHRRLVRALLHDPLDQHRQGLPHHRRRIRAAHPAPAHTSPPHQRERVSGHRAEGADEPPQHGFGDGFLDLPVPVGELDPEMVPRDDAEGQWIVSPLDRAQIGELVGEVPRIVLEHQQRVELRARPGRLLDLRQSQMLMRDQGRLPPLQTGEQVGDRPPAVQRYPDRHGVHHEPGYRLHPRELCGTASNRGAEHHLGAPLEPGQHHRPRALHHRVQRQSVVTGHRLQPGVELRREVGDAVLISRPGGRLRDRRVLVEAGQLRLPGRACRVLVLPIQPGQVVPVGCLADPLREPAAGLVRLSHLVEDDRHRPAVGQDVVVDDHQAVPVLAEPGQHQPEQRARGQVESLFLFPPGEGLDGRIGVALAREVDLPPGQDDVSSDGLERLPRREPDEAHPELGAPCEDRFPRGPEPGHVQRPVQLQDPLRLVNVEALFFEGRLEEQPLLERGERPNLLGTRYGDRQLGLLLRGEGDQGTAVGGVCECGTRYGRQPCGGPLVEDLEGRHQQTGPGRARGQPHRDDRVASQGEEAFVDTDPVQAQQLGEESAQDALRLGGGFATGGVRPEDGRGQRPPVHLAVAGQRKPVQRDHDSRDHVLRQHRPKTLTEDVGIHVRHRVADQASIDRHHDGLVDIWPGGQRGLDLTRLDPEPADLHLVVGSAREQQLAVGGPLGEIPCPVHPAAGYGRIRHEPLRRQRRPVQVAVRKAGTGKVEVADRARRQGLQRRVEHLSPAARKRTADRQHGTQRVTRLEQVPRRAQRRLRRPVQVPDPRSGDRPSHFLHCVCGHHVATRQHLVEAGEGLRRLLRQRPEAPCGQMHLRHAGRDRPPQTPGVHRARLGDHYTGTREKRYPDLVEGRVEGVRRMHEDRVTGVHRPAGVPRQLRDAPVRDGHSLRDPRRPGGVHHIRQVPRSHRDRRRVARTLVRDDDRLDPLRHAVARRGRARHQGRPRVRDHERHPPRGMGSVHRHVRRSRLPYGEQRHHQVCRAFHQDRHAVAAADAPTGQPPGQPARELVQPPVGQNPIPIDHGHRVGRPLHLTGEQLRHRRRG